VIAVDGLRLRVRPATAPGGAEREVSHAG
jgi:hypothetical protein